MNDTGRLSDIIDTCAEAGGQLPGQVEHNIGECPQCQRVAEMIYWNDDGVNFHGCIVCYDEFWAGTKRTEYIASATVSTATPTRH